MTAPALALASPDNLPVQTYCYGLVWRIAALLPLLLGIGLPLLMVANHERFDFPVAIMIAVFAVAGVWGFLYVVKYAVVIEADGLTIHRFAQPSLTMAWREIISVEEKSGSITFQTAAGRKIRISSQFPAISAVTSAAAQNLPDAAFESPDKRPPIEPDAKDYESWRAVHLAMRRFWLRLALRLFITAGLLAGGAFLAEAALARLDLRAVPSIVVGFLRILQSSGYALGVCLLVLALLALIMSLQENVRLRKLPPAA